MDLFMEFTEPSHNNPPVYVERYVAGWILSPQQFLLRGEELAAGEEAQGFVRFSRALNIANDRDVAQVRALCIRLLPYEEGDARFICNDSSDVPNGTMRYDYRSFIG